MTRVGDWSPATKVVLDTRKHTRRALIKKRTVPSIAEEEMKEKMAKRSRCPYLTEESDGQRGKDAGELMCVFFFEMYTCHFPGSRINPVLFFS